jgi:hypothetical protein
MVELYTDTNRCKIKNWKETVQKKSIKEAKAALDCSAISEEKEA